MIERIPDLVNADANLVRRGRYLSTTFLMEIGDKGYLDRRSSRAAWSRSRRGRSSRRTTASRCARRATNGRLFWRKVPPPGHQRHLRAVQARQAHDRGRPASVHGEPALHQGRARRAAQRGGDDDEPALRAELRAIRAAISTSTCSDRPHRLYIEEAGQGIPLLCLHTAGSDGRQYRGLLNDKRITDNYRVIVFDMPWHGKSSPPAGLAGRGVPPHLARLRADDPARSPTRWNSTSRW